MVGLSLRVRSDGSNDKEKREPCVQKRLSKPRYVMPFLTCSCAYLGCEYYVICTGFVDGQKAFCLQWASYGTKVRANIVRTRLPHTSKYMKCSICGCKVDNTECSKSRAEESDPTHDPTHDPTLHVCGIARMIYVEWGSASFPVPCHINFSLASPPFSDAICSFKPVSVNRKRQIRLTMMEGASHQTHCMKSPTLHLDEREWSFPSHSHGMWCSQCIVVGHRANHCNMTLYGCLHKYAPGWVP